MDLTAFFGRSGLLPHGYCITWSPTLLWSMVGADAAIAAAYFSIPLAILRFVRLRGTAPGHPWLAGLFSAFIFACGVTHLLDIWTLWRPDYGVQVLGKLVTAAVSMGTAVVVWPLVPRLLKLPTVDQLQGAIAALEAEVGRRRTAEQHLADLEQNLAATLASIDAGFIATDVEGRVTRMNAVAEAVTGWRQDDALGQPLWTVFDRDGRPADWRTRSPVDVMLELGTTVDKVYPVVAIARDGRRTPLEVKAALTRGDDGQARGLAMVFRDMTRLNAAEAAQQRLAAIVESSHDAIIGKTLDGRITNWNGAAAALFGYSADEAIGAPVQMLIPPEREAEEMRILAELARGQRVPPFDTVRQARGGRLVDVSITISPIRDPLGRIVGASKIARDITGQKQAEQARLKAQRLEAENRQIQEASRLKSLFLANMSHELRTPLNAIIGFAELMHAGAVPAGSPKQHEFLGHIAASGHHLLQLINDVLDLSKVESGKFEFSPEPLDLPRLVQEVCDVLHTAIQRKRLGVVVAIDPVLTSLVLDPARLKQALYNYLSNAIKFTPEGGRITLRAGPAGPQHLRIEVEDTGIGIRAADLRRLFVEFQQLDTGYSKQHGGTGLGLALTRRLVEAQGGLVGVRSQHGQGSVFHLVLPRVHGQGGAIAQRLLVVESDLALQDQLVQGLSAAGFQVDAAATAAQAVAQAGDRTYDALTLALRLPDQGGLGALDGIRSQGPSSGSPVLALSLGDADGPAATFAVANVLCKPIRTDEVAAAMAGLALPRDRRPRVLVVDDDPLAQDLMRATLLGMGIDTHALGGGRQALKALDELRPDAIVLDLMMPEFDGFATLDALRDLPAWRDTPVLVWTSLMLTDEEYGRLAQSARAILGKGGGGLAEMLAQLARWRPPALAAGDRYGS